MVAVSWMLALLGCSPSDRLGQGEGTETVMVIVAARDLERGLTITEEDLYAVQIPSKYLPSGVFLSPEHVVGRIPIEIILTNEFIRAERLSDSESGRMAEKIPRQMRAIELPQGVSPAKLGDYVDLWWTPPGGEPCVLSAAVFVVALAQERLGLLVTPEDGLRLLAASRDDSFRVALRNDVDAREEVKCR